MKKLIVILSAISILLSASGCKLTTQDYNDKIVEILDSNGIAIEATVESYNSSIPNLVTEESEIDTVAMQESLATAVTESLKTEDLLLLESKNAEQQTEVQEELAVYISALKTYLEKYTEMVEYYSTTSYKTSPGLVGDYDSTLYDSDNLFDQFLESNNTLAEILKSHI